MMREEEAQGKSQKKDHRGHQEPPETRQDLRRSQRLKEDPQEDLSPELQEDLCPELQEDLEDPESQKKGEDPPGAQGAHVDL